MSKHAPSTLSTDTGTAGTLEAGLDAFQSSPEFHGPVENLDDHQCNDHFAHIYETREEKFAAAVPFIRHGLNNGERIMYVIDEATEADITAVLRDAGVNVDAARDSGALTFHTVNETYLRNGSFDVDEMIEFYGDTVDEVTDEYAALRIVAEMTWLDKDDTTVEQFIEYEQRINDLFAETESLAICQYNRNRFNPDAVRNVVRTHPHLIYEGAACHNFYYTPPEEFFGEDAPALENGRMLRTLRDRTVAKTNLQRHERFLETLYEVTADSSRSFEAKVEHLLELGAERFDLDIGYFTRTTDDTFEIVTAVGDHDQIQSGVTDTVCDTYCEKLLASPGTIAVQNAADTGWTDDRAYDRFGLDAYFATTVRVGGEEYGTLCFASESPREDAYTDAEQTFLGLMGQWIEHELERQRRERFLHECYTITSDPGLGFDAKLEQLLNHAREWMDLDAAGLTHLPEWGGKFLNEFAVGYGEDADDTVWTDPDDGHYCRAVIESDNPVGKADVRGTEWEDDPIHRDHGLSCYLGTKVTNGPTPYGTLWVGSAEPRDREFANTEQTFLELIGQWVSYELERRDHNAAQQELYMITSDPDREFDEKLDALFELGRDRFNADLGGMTVVNHENDSLEVEHVSGDHPSYEPGLEFPLEETFCATVVDNDDEVSIVDPAAAGCADRAVHSNHGFDTYLGAHIEIDGARDRTFFFMAEESRDHEFSDAERSFLDLMGQWVEYELERQQREQELRERTEHLNALVETTPECIKTVAPDGTLLQMNPAGLEMVEAPEESVVTGENVYDLIAPEDREKFTAFNERICDGESDTLEFDIIGLEGTRRHMESHAKPLERPDGETVHVALTRDVTEQKEREAELRESKNQLRALFDVLPVAVFVAEDDGELVEWNDAAENIWGGEVAESDSVAEYEAYNGWWADTGDPVDPEEWPIARALDGEPVTDPDEIEIEGFDGERRTILNHGMPVRDADGEVSRAVVTLVDITEQKERERELEQYETLAETASDVILTIDDDGRIQNVNPTVEEMFGHAPADLEGESLTTLMPDRFADDHRAGFAQYLQTGDRQLDWDYLELPGARADDTEIPLAISFSEYEYDGDHYFTGIVRDITERKEREAELQQTKNRFETVFEQSDDGIFILDPDADGLVDANPAAAEMTGYTREELLSLAPSDLHPDEMEQFRAFLAEAREQGSAWSEDLHCRHKDGHDIPAEVTASSITLDGRDLVLAMVRHIEERKTHERYQRDLYDIIADTGASFDEKLDRLLELGRDRFGLENAYFNDVGDDAVEVVEAIGPNDQIEAGTSTSLDGTYCEKLLASSGQLAAADAAERGWTDDPAYETYGLDAYLATTVHVGGEVDGLLCFSSETPRDEPFTDAEQTFLDLMGQCLGYELECRRRERFLRESHKITADPDLEFGAKVERLLDLGRDWMGLDAAGLTHLPEWDGQFLTEHAIGYGDDGDGDGVVDASDDMWRDPGEGCFCRQAIESDEPVGMADVRGTAWADDRIHQEHGLSSYLGTKVTNGSTPHGTLWVGSTEPRDHEFTETEKTFLELIGQWVSYELERRELNDAQRELYEVVADPALDTDAKLGRLLDVGCEYLNLPVGLVTCERDEAFEIEQMHGTHPDLDEGTLTPPLTDNYCRRVVDTGDSISVADAGAAGWDGDALYHEFDLQCYAGTQVTVSGATYGTLCFTDTAPREEFTETERAFLDLMGQCVSYELERAEREEHLLALSTLGRELLDAETPVDIADRVIDIIDESVLPTEAAVALYDEETGNLELAASTDGATQLPMKALIAQGDGIGWDVFVSGDVQRVTEPFDDTPSTGPHFAEAVAHSLGTHGVLIVGSDRIDGFTHDAADTIQTAVTTLRAALTRADREQQLQDREQTLEEQNQTLARLNRINDTIRSIDQALVEATTHDEVERVVCEELANVGPYELAWIGEHDEVTDEIAPREAAGAEKGYLEASTITADDAPEGCGPSGRAVKTGEPQFVNNVLTDESFEPWRQDALNRGYHATAAFPLTYNDTQYGVLNLYAGQPGVFDELERDVLTELSATIAHTLNAIETKKGLVSPTADELEFSVTDDNLEMLVISQEFDCAFELKRLVPQDDGRIRAFFAVDGATPDEVRGFTSRLPVEELRLVSKDSDDETCLFEAVLTEGSLSQAVVDHGGRLRSVEVEDGVAAVVVRLGVDADTRTFVEMLKQKYPDSVMVANRTVQLSHKSALEFVETLDLTDRQREVLQTAFFSGYFEEPRNRTATEIADAMDIAQPTFNSHLRAAMRKLYRRLFEET